MMLQNMKWWTTLKTNALLVLNITWAVLAVAIVSAMFTGDQVVKTGLTQAGVVANGVLVLFVVTPILAVLAMKWRRVVIFERLARYALALFVLVIALYLLALLYISSRGMGILMLFFMVVAYLSLKAITHPEQKS